MNNQPYPHFSALLENGIDRTHTVLPTLSSQSSNKDRRDPLQSRKCLHHRHPTGRMSSSAGFKTDRRQQERFTTRIRNVIREYPWGLGVIKEFLANADDAGSEHFAVIFDKRQHSKVSLQFTALIFPLLRTVHCHESKGPRLSIYLQHV